MQGLHRCSEKKVSPKRPTFQHPAKVKIDNDTGIVRLFNYEMNIGFSYCIIELRLPNVLTGIGNQVVVKNKTEFLF